MRKVPITDEALRALKPALAGGRITVRRELVAGVSQLYLTPDGNLYVVLRPEGWELVVVAVAGSRLKQSRQAIIDFAVANGYRSIRFHTRHPERLQKGLAGLPVQLVEIRKVTLGRDELVYRLELVHGR